MSLMIAEQHGPVRRLILNRPDARNALNVDLMTALEEALAEAASESAVRSVVIAASGPAFCAGHDLKEMLPHTRDPDGGERWFRALFTQCSVLMRMIATLPKPVIAEVQGIATAAGCQLVAACDLAVASTAARFATPGVNIGLFCSTPAVPVTRALAPKHAMELLLTGDAIDAETALRWALVNQVVAPEELTDATLHLAARTARASVATVALGKRALAEQSGLPLADAYDRASEAMTRNMLLRDAAVGIGALLSKTDPVWEDR